jgi:hypothetical protein
MHVSLHRLHGAMTERGWGEPAPDGQRMIELPGLYSGRFDMAVFENTSKRRKTSHQNQCHELTTSTTRTPGVTWGRTAGQSRRIRQPQHRWLSQLRRMEKEKPGGGGA